MRNSRPKPYSDPLNPDARARDAAESMVIDFFNARNELLACSVKGCANNMTALITTDNGAEPYRLCSKHLNAALDGIAIEQAADYATREHRRQKVFFDELSPIEQWQLEGR